MTEQTEVQVEEVAQEETKAGMQSMAEGNPTKADTPLELQLAALTNLCEQLCTSTEKQCKYARKLLFFTRLLTIIFGTTLAVLLCVGLAAAPRIASLAEGADHLIVQAQSVATQAQSIATELQTVSSQLAEADITGLLGNMDTLVLQSQSSITEALGKLTAAVEVVTSFDIATLNSSIQDLHQIIMPLAQLLGK